MEMIFLEKQIGNMLRKKREDKYIFIVEQILACSIASFLYPYSTNSSLSSLPPIPSILLGRENRQGNECQVRDGSSECYLASCPIYIGEEGYRRDL